MNPTEPPLKKTSILRRRPARPQRGNVLFAVLKQLRAGPPYSVLVDTNFINFSIKNKIDLVWGMMDCLYAQCVPHVTDRAMAELEAGRSTAGASRREGPRFVRLPCTHPGTYADDCICRRVRQHKCYTARRATRT